MTSKVSGGEYDQFLIALKNVCHEVEYKLEKESQIELLETNPEVRSMMESMPAMSIDDVAKKVDEYLVDKKGTLLLFEAAKRSGIDSLAKFYLLKWEVKLKEKITKKFGKEQEPIQLFSMDYFSLNSQSHSVSFEKADDKIEKISQKFLWPKFQESQVKEKELINAQNHLLSKELIFRHFHPREVAAIPPFVLPFMGDLTPSASANYLIQRYAPLMKEIHFSNPKVLTDQEISELLNRFMFAEVLNLSDCIALTAACLKEGHPRLKTIILNGTSIQLDAIDRKKFPSLEKIQQDNFISTLHLDDLNKETSWVKLDEKIKNANFILGSTDILDNMFRKNPSKEGVAALLSLVENKSKLDEYWKINIADQVAGTFLSTWQCRPIEDWKTSDSIGNHLLKALIKLWVKIKDKNASKSISSAFYNTLTLTDEKKHDQIAEVSLKDVYRLRALLVFLRTIQWPEYKNILERMFFRLQQSDTILFYKKESVSTTRDKALLTHELMNEIYVELSYRCTLDMALPFSLIKDPSKVTRGKEPFQNDSLVMVNLFLNATCGEADQPGPMYKMVTDHTLASAFAVRVSERKYRESMLENLLKNFSEYRSSSHYYPLPKLVLGVIELKDIPDFDRGGPLCSYLLNYNGVFLEDLSDDLKEAYWKALCYGQLGGVNKTLIDSLVSFYSKHKASETWKKRVLTALNDIGGAFKGPLTGISYVNPLTDNSAKGYAREKLKELKS